MFFMKCNYICFHFSIFQLEIFPQVFLYPNCHKTYLSDRYIQYHNLYHINHRKHQMISIMSLSHALSEIYLYVHRYTFFYINNLQDDLTYYL